MRPLLAAAAARLGALWHKGKVGGRVAQLRRRADAGPARLNNTAGGSGGQQRPGAGAGCAHPGLCARGVNRWPCRRPLRPEPTFSFLSSLVSLGLLLPRASLAAGGLLLRSLERLQSRWRSREARLRERRLLPLRSRLRLRRPSRLRSRSRLRGGLRCDMSTRRGGVRCRGGVRRGGVRRGGGVRPRGGSRRRRGGRWYRAR